MLAFVLGVTGKTVLHATAVEVSGRSMAILGPPGSGKSTLAAQLCLAGATLITEDTMRVDVLPPHAFCYRGPGQLRLRTGAARLAEGFSGFDGDPAPDGRFTVRPERSATRRSRLDALLVPRIVPNAVTVSLNPLGPRDRTHALIRNPRLIGWRRAEEIGSHFETVAGVAAAVPVLEAQIPLDRAMAPGLGEELLERIGGQYWASAPV